MRIYSRLDNHFKTAQNETSDALLIALNNPEIKKGLSQAIEELVYSHYDSFTEAQKESPKVYTPRREDGGLSDPNNMFATSYRDSEDLITGILRTYAGVNTDYPGNKPDVNYSIDQIVVTGDGYTWKGSKFAKETIPRDFYAYALATGLITEPQLKELISKELKKKGW